MNQSERILAQMAMERERTAANIQRHNHDPYLRAAAAGVGLYVGWHMEKERQSYKAAGLKPPLSLRIYNGIMVLLGIPIVLGCIALAAAVVLVGLGFVYAIVVVGLEAVIGPIPFPGWWPDALVPNQVQG